MFYLRSFTLPNRTAEETHLNDRPCRTGEGSVYPFKVFVDRAMPVLTFDAITIFYGGNGSGKSTLLNLLAYRLNLLRGADRNRTEYFEEYAALCDVEGEAPEGSRLVTSDDVFRYLWDVRAINGGVEQSRSALYKEYSQEKKRMEAGDFPPMRSLSDYEALCRRVEIRRSSQSQYTARRVRRYLPERSNGESAFRYFTEEMRGEGALYLLDEPENSMSPALQGELASFLLESARCFGCQLVLATHSPFLLALHGARVYDLDALPPGAKAWTELANVRAYYDFFRAHSREFEQTPE